ncbi:MAG: AAA family ATPase [Clostridiales bacterium]|nr:AAA family ATPase [Clostridiales bacterium]
MKKKDIILSDEQQLFIDKAKEGKNILVDACIGSGKTTAIQRLCCDFPESVNILYLTYNKLLKLDAKSKIKNQNVFVTNYHGFAYYVLQKYKIPESGVSDLIQCFNQKKPDLDKYDVLIIDEYQDIEQEFAEMLEYIKSTNPQMQIIAVGDIDQKIYDKTTLDVIIFINKFLENHIKLQFTNCFRISSNLSDMLGRVWHKKINGINENCIVEQMSSDEVVEFLSTQEPKDILCLGSRTGELSDVLNKLENNYSDKFNKRTVYASIQDDDAGATQPNKTSAIFTTFDSSKGMERKICVVFDFTESYWQVRIKKPQQSYEILRNIFCVAASRGKERIIFVKNEEAMLSEETLLEQVETNFKFNNVDISNMFDFKYKEDVEKCFSLLKIEQLDYNDYNEIYIKNNDALIDLSPCIGIYQEAEFFNSYDIDKDIKLKKKLSKNRKIYNEILKEDSIEKKILFLVSEETKQKRYRTQVNTPFVSQKNRTQLVDRLREKFSENENVQIQCKIPFYDKDGINVFNAMGIADVVKEDTVYELKFVSELMHTHFLQCACYMIALNLDKGILWNTRNNKAYQIMVPNKDEFLDFVTNTITKGYIKEYNKPKFAIVDTETNFADQVMSIGIVIADTENYHPIEMKYYILNPEYKSGGMFSNALKIGNKKPDMVNTRKNIISDIENLLQKHGIQAIFAYNASFDYRHLPELSRYNWYDIMKLAAYKQYNAKITDDMECYSTGRLKHNSGVDDMVRLLTDNLSYCETHNALCDAIDELNIMRHLGQKFEEYNIAIYRSKSIADEKRIDINLNSHKENTVSVKNDNQTEEWKRKNNNHISKENINKKKDLFKRIFSWKKK